MNGHGQSDGPVVPANPPNKAPAAEAGEERGLAKGNAASETRPGHSAGNGVSSELDRVRQVAVRDKDARFTALHHVSVHRLMRAFDDLKKSAAPGVDGVLAGVRAGPAREPAGPARAGAVGALPG